MKLAGGAVSWLQPKGASAPVQSAPLSAPGGVDQIFLGRGSRPPGNCPPGYQLSSSGPGQQKSWYCNRVVSAVPQRTAAPAPYVPPPPPPAPVITISPNFQQDFNAQVSPTITAQIGSPGASASSAPTQQTEKTQQAAGGGYSGPSGPSASEIALRERLAAMEAEQRVRAEYAAKAAAAPSAPSPPSAPSAPVNQVPEAPPPAFLPPIPTLRTASAGPAIPNLPAAPSAPAPVWKKYLPYGLLVIAGIGALLLTGTRKGNRHAKR